ncbi:MAG: tyrosine-type recombinase/integrase [Nitratireductor sp.]
MKLTHDRVRNFVLPQGRREMLVFDDLLAGFGLRVREGGSRNWIVQYKVGSRNQRMTLGSIEMLNAEKARKVAQEILAKVRLGEDPQAERIDARSKSDHDFAEIARLFIIRQQTRLRPSSLADTRRYLERYAVKLHPLAFGSIGRGEIASVLREIAQQRGAVSADRARAALSACFTWAMKEGWCDTNPVLATNTHAGPIGRDRVLDREELAAIWNALPEGDYGSIIRLLILTGQRRSEISELRWSEVDFERALVELPASRTKNKRSHQVPLSQPALALLKACRVDAGREHMFGSGQRGFQGHGRAKRDLDARLRAGRSGIGPDTIPDIEPWRVHDIRRSVATGMADIGVEPHIIEAVLNHVSGHKAGVAGIYNRAAYTSEKRKAFEAWGEVVSGCERVREE